MDPKIDNEIEISQDERDLHFVIGDIKALRPKVSLDPEFQNTLRARLTSKSSIVSPYKEYVESVTSVFVSWYHSRTFFGVAGALLAISLPRLRILRLDRKTQLLLPLKIW